MNDIDFGDINYYNVDTTNVDRKDIREMTMDELKYIAASSPLSEKKEDKEAMFKKGMISMGIAFAVFFLIIVSCYIFPIVKFLVVVGILLVFFSIGIAIIVNQIKYSENKLRKIYTKPFLARVVMNDKSVHSHTHNGHTSHTTVYCPIFLTNYNGNFYVLKGMAYTNVFVRNPGEIVTLYADPNVREYIKYIDFETAHAGKFGGIIFGAVFILVSVVLGAIFFLSGAIQ